MRYLTIILALFLLVPSQGYGQEENEGQGQGVTYVGISFMPAKGSVGIGIEGGYLKNAIGFFGNFILDVNSKHNSSALETGVSADLALLLNKTNEIESFISIAAGVKTKLYKEAWVQFGGGVTLWDEFTEHDGRYWVYRGRESAFNVTGGFSVVSKPLGVVIRGNTEPLALTLGINYMF